jgi:hypothetical protein
MPDFHPSERDDAVFPELAGRTDDDLGRALQSRLVSGAIAPRDFEFASSLLAGWTRFGRFTPRQRPHVERLISERQQPRAAGVVVGTLDRLSTLFRAALEHGLRRPRLTFAREGRKFTVNPAKPDGANPGALYVKADGQYLGKVLGGRFMSVRDAAPEAVEQAQTLLAEIAADPVNAARVHGHATGMCCFCARTLTDGRSVAMGYGPICAEKYGLEWGEQRAEQFVDVALAEAA